MFSKTKLVTPYFQQITSCSKISKIIDTRLQNNSHSTQFFKLSVNCFGNFRAERYLLKIGVTSLVSPNIESVSVIYP